MCRAFVCRGDEGVYRRVWVGVGFVVFFLRYVEVAYKFGVEGVRGVEYGEV